MATVDKKLIDCYWFLQNQCSKGESCEYRHWKGALENLITCKQWSEGKCTNKECNFRHPSAVMPKKPVVCYYFTHGGCMKGSSCPYSHDVDPEVADKQVIELELAKKKQEEELRRLQEQRKREEERLAKLKAEEEALSRKKQGEIRKAEIKNEVYRPKQANQRQPKVTPKEKPSKVEKPQENFVKSLEDIQREKELEEKKKEEKKQKLVGKRERPTAANPESKPVRPLKSQKTGETQKNAKKDLSSAAAPAPSDSSNFGVKSLEEILKERENKSANGSAASTETTSTPITTTATTTTTTPATTSTATPPSKQSIDQLRKKNEEKFKAASPKNTKRQVQSSATTSSVSSSVPQLKKVESAPTTSTAASSTATPPKKATNNDMVDLGENGDINIDDEFDKELNELEGLMNV